MGWDGMGWDPAEQQLRSGISGEDKHGAVKGGRDGSKLSSDRIAEQRDVSWPNGTKDGAEAGTDGWMDRRIWMKDEISGRRK